MYIDNIKHCLLGPLFAYKHKYTFAETLMGYSAVSLRFLTPLCGGKAHIATTPLKTQVHLWRATATDVAPIGS